MVNTPQFAARWRQAIPDLMAGVMIAGIVLPEAVAYAGIANLPALTGIIAACVGLLVYALVGSSRFAIVSATSSSAVVLAAAIRSLQLADLEHSLVLATGLVLVPGAFFCMLAALRLGRIAHFIARPAVRGLAMGLGIVIVVRQVAKITGLPSTETNALPLIVELLRGVEHWSMPSLILAASALFALYGLRRWPRLPGPLLVMVAGIIASDRLQLPALGVAVVGPIQLSSIQFSVPVLSLDEWSRIAELAVALMLILFAESYGAIRAAALKHGERVDVNRELFAIGMANLFSGLWHGMPVGAGYSATMANEALGARSRLAGLAAAVYLLVVVSLLMRYVERIPQPVLAVIVIYAMQHSLSLQPLRPYLQWKRDRLIVAVAIIAVLVLGVLNGLLAAIAVSLVLLIRGFAQPRLSVLGQRGDSHDYLPLGSHPDAHALPGILILRPEQPLFFANVSEVLESAYVLLTLTPDTHALILSLEESPDVDGTAIEVLQEFAMRVNRRGCTVILARLKEPVAEVLTQAASLDAERLHLTTGSVAAAVGLAANEQRSGV